MFIPDVAIIEEVLGKPVNLDKNKISHKLKNKSKYKSTLNDSDFKNDLGKEMSEFLVKGYHAQKNLAEWVRDTGGIRYRKRNNRGDAFENAAIWALLEEFGEESVKCEVSSKELGLDEDTEKFDIVVTLPNGHRFLILATSDLWEGGYQRTRGWCYQMYSQKINNNTDHFVALVYKKCPSNEIQVNKNLYNLFKNNTIMYLPQLIDFIKYFKGD